MEKLNSDSYNANYGGGLPMLWYIIGGIVFMSILVMQDWLIKHRGRVQTEDEEEDLILTGRRVSSSQRQIRSVSSPKKSRKKVR